MPFYFRKSISAGPFRFNFSSGGVGVSVGVRGLRIGTGPRGHYIHAGSNGFYYRASLGRASSGRPPQRPSPENQTPTPPSAGVDLVEIESANVLAMQDETFADLLRELNEKAGQPRLAMVVPIALGIAGLGVGLVAGPPWPLLAAMALPGWLLGGWLDSYKRTSVLYYDIEGEQQGRYSRLASSFDELAACAGRWHIQAQGAVRDLMTRKRNAGATNLVNRTSTNLTYALPDIVKSNVTPPSMQAGRQTLYFLPDVVLVADGRRFGAIPYPDLRMDYRPSRFIEDGRVPSDAQVIDYTWQYTNKSGGPDRRFNNNRQLPVCLYESLHLTSPSGLNELFEFSRTGVTNRLAAAVDEMRLAPSTAPAQTTSPASTAPASRPEPDSDAPAEHPPPAKRRLAGKVAIGLAVLVALYALLAPPRETKQATAPPTGVTTSGPLHTATPTAVKPDDRPVATKEPDAKAEPQPPPVQKDDRPLSTVEVRELQERLKALGFDPGFIDGIPGPQTAAAIRRFEASVAVPPQGNIDRPTLQRLRDAKPGR